MVRRTLPAAVDTGVAPVPSPGMMTPVSRNLGSSGAPHAAQAVRVTRPGWRDPRLWVGVLIVAVSVVAGARVLASADDTVSVWAAARDMGAGDTITADDLVVRRVRFGETTGLERYFGAASDLPAELRLTAWRRRGRAAAPHGRRPGR